MIYLLKYWKQALLLVIAVVFVISWNVAREAYYKRGYVDATAKISRELAETARKQTEEVLKQERKQAADFAEKQAQLEKEKEHAQVTINNLRGELSRLQQYARNQGRRQYLPAADKTARASDEAFTKGWELFGKCANEYAGMAEIADKQRNDLAEWQAYGETVSGK